MANYRPAYDRTRLHEGSYSDDPIDRGGETWCGVSRVMHPGWIGWGVVDSFKSDPQFPATLHGSTQLAELVADFYYREFWDPASLEILDSQDVANELFDTSVNMGPRWAKAFYRRALNVLNRDGKLFPDLAPDANWVIAHNRANALTRKGDDAVLLVALNVLQGARYIDLMEAAPSQERFARGWLLQRVSLKP